MKNSLEALFGSKERWRIIKVFLLNQGGIFSAAEISEKTQVSKRGTTQILKQLVGAKFVSQRKRKGNLFYTINARFPLLNELKSLVIKSNTYPQCESLSRLEKLSGVKLAIVTGIFINEPKARTDLLLVGDGMSQAKTNNLIASLEAELGQEIKYSIMELSEFKYRANMFDKFIMEIMELPHQMIVNRIPGVIQQLLTSQKR